MSLKPRQRKILSSLDELGGQATTRQIAEKAGLDTNGVSQSLGALSGGGHVTIVGGKRGDTVWKLASRGWTDALR